MDLDAEIPAQPSNLELLSTLSPPLAPVVLPATTVAAATTTNTTSHSSGGISLAAPLTTPLSPSQLPVSVTHFSQNGMSGVQKETLFTDSSLRGKPSATNPFTNPFIGTDDELDCNGQKFATIGRSNPFTSPNKSKNPFLDRLEAPAQNGGGIPTATEQTAGSPMSTSPSTSPEASLDPVSDNGSSTSTLNKIVSIEIVLI